MPPALMRSRPCAQAIMQMYNDLDAFGACIEDMRLKPSEKSAGDMTALSTVLFADERTLSIALEQARRLGCRRQSPYADVRRALTAPSAPCRSV